MDASLFVTLIDPAILLFFFGILAGTLRSNLEIPPAIAKFCSLYLLLVIGFKGGLNLHETGFTAAMGWALLGAFILALAVPAWSFLVLRRRLSPFDAAAVAATYGSVSAVTFITAVSFAEQQGLDAGGYMAVALVLMESPAIIMAVLLANLVRSRAAREAAAAPLAAPQAGGAPLTMRGVLHEAFTDGAHLLLLGAVLIGYLTGDIGKKAMLPFTDLQKGILAFFLLDMGLLVARRAKDALGQGAFLTAFGILMPLFNATVALALSKLLGLSAGDAFLLTVLTASASYIVVPAVVRYAIPEANPSLYFTMSLAITFPFNIIFGLPLYLWAVERLWN
ncbi:MAG: sodium-dependent bicarbonate transport family permease [Gammaproteobacteria bacterium]|nr:sodium-dependent bicarbonate transport family permease [Gammaproteobacteria bacterium]